MLHAMLLHESKGIYPQNSGTQWPWLEILETIDQNKAFSPKLTSQVTRIKKWKMTNTEFYLKIVYKFQTELEIRAGINP